MWGILFNWLSAENVKKTWFKHLLIRLSVFFNIQSSMPTKAVCLSTEERSTRSLIALRTNDVTFAQNTRQTFHHPRNHGIIIGIAPNCTKVACVSCLHMRTYPTLVCFFLCPPSKLKTFTQWFLVISCYFYLFIKFSDSVGWADDIKDWEYVSKSTQMGWRYQHRNGEYKNDFHKMLTEKQIWELN